MVTYKHFTEIIKLLNSEHKASLNKSSGQANEITYIKLLQSTIKNLREIRKFLFDSQL